ncbi:GNAT family N-acetyltransferase [Candidatus Gracilibacteria bacterium]|nr:GNAT family N-acetyltransferase [Candidatus Gracilibacteria bacterium]
MDKSIELISNRIILRQLKDKDTQDIFNLFKNKKINYWFGGGLSLNETKKYIKSKIKKFNNKEEFCFGIILKDSNKIIGEIDLIDFDIDNKKAGLLFWLGEEYWKKGLATEAIQLILKYSFKNLKLNRIYANIEEENIDSIKLIKNNNFIYEGLLRKSILRNKEFKNELVFSLLKNDYNLLILANEIYINLLKGHNILLAGKTDSGKTWFVKNILISYLQNNGIKTKYFEGCDKIITNNLNNKVTIVDEVEIFEDQKLLEKLYPEERPYYSKEYLKRVKKWYSNLSKIKTQSIYIVTRNEFESLNNIKNNIKQVGFCVRSLYKIIFQKISKL